MIGRFPASEAIQQATTRSAFQCLVESDGFERAQFEGSTGVLLHYEEGPA
jgi:hypothetical protein